VSDKLRRESIRLTQIQDISGCQLVVQDMADQDRVVESLAKLFENVTIVDRRKKPSHGYRAVHVVVKEGNKLVEIQVRTALQHLWAELSEKLSDILTPAIKYGGGDEKIQEMLTRSSGGITELEDIEVKLQDQETRLATLLSQGGSKAEQVPSFHRKIEDIHRRVMPLRQGLSDALQYAIDQAAMLTGDDDDISN
jgi:ppGpp synthetase/RelA/SpoT-type nucleotidyltranferase